MSSPITAKETKMVNDYKPEPRPLSAGMATALREHTTAGSVSLKEHIEENDCPGHVASEADSKVCARCGTHIDSLRPDADDIDTLATL